MEENNVEGLCGGDSSVIEGIQKSMKTQELIDKVPSLKILFVTNFLFKNLISQPGTSHQHRTTVSSGFNRRRKQRATGRSCFKAQG